MAKYRVNKGYTWGIDKLPSGSIIDLEPESASFFVPVRLTPVEESETVDADDFVVRTQTGIAGQRGLGGGLYVPDEDGDTEDWDPELTGRVIDVLEGAGLTPGNVQGMTDAQLEDVNGVGSATLRQIRAVYPRGSKGV